MTYRHSGITQHWLAINGSQPAVPENPGTFDSAEEASDVSILPKEMQVYSASVLAREPVHS
jgi:hypothetical protein